MIKKQKANEQPKELVFGIHPVLELLQAKRRKLLSIYTTSPEPKAWDQIARLLPTHVPIHKVSRQSLHALAGTQDHQGIVAWATPFVFRKKFFDPTTSPYLVLLDGIQDSRNVGAIIRSAYCTGMHGVILCQKQGAPLNAAALKAAAGLAEWIDIMEMPSVGNAVQELKKAGYTLYVTNFQGEDATTVAYQKPLCIVIGSEGQGVSRSVVSQGVAITLPQRRADISYNASVAAGIILFLVARSTQLISR